MTSTAVVPFYKVSRQAGTVRYRCRERWCHFVAAFGKDDKRDTRMILLARHLVDAHGIGPLARGLQALQAVRPEAQGPRLLHDLLRHVREAQAVTDRPRAIIASYPNGTLKPFCPCGNIITYRPAVSAEPPAQCAFCRRRYQWSARTSGVGDSLERGSAFLHASSKSATAPTPEVRALPPPPPLLAPLKTDYAWTARPFIVHPVPRNAEVVTLADEPTETSGRGTGWSCHHGMDQIGGRRCIECCSSKPQHYVLLVARGGTPARYRWLCDGCLSLFEADGRVAGGNRTHVENMANRARPAWVEAREA